MIVIEFDGFCNFCDGFINWVNRFDSQNRFRYRALSAAGDSINVHTENRELLTRSKAIWYILKNIQGHPLKYLSFIFITPILADYGYRIFAKNRYKWFGKKEECSIQDYEKLKDKLLK